MPDVEVVWLPGTLCDERVFGDLETVLDLPSRHIRISDFERVESAAEAILGAAGDRLVPIGFSLGGFVALELLRRAPERLAGVVLMSGNAHPDAPGNAAVRREEVAFVRENGMAALIERNWPRFVGQASLSDLGLRDLMVSMAEAVGPEGHARQAEMNIARPDFRNMVTDSPVPLLVLAGDEDSLCLPERYVAAAQGASASLETVTGAGHFLPLEAPREVGRLTAGFLKELRR